MSLKQKIILGIDPGTIVMGYGVILAEANKITMKEMGVLKLSKYEDGYTRLHLIFKKVSALIALHQPNYFAIEAPFFGKNVQSMLKLGRAQGVAMAAAIQGGLEVTEYSPKKVKQSVTGNGNAVKEQVQKMVHQICQTEVTKELMDATDAVAVAICHAYQLHSPLPQAKKGKAWEQFLKENSHRILTSKV